MNVEQETKMQIGIPRAMSFYTNYPFLYGFLTELGIEIVLSDKTTKKTLAKGSSLVVSETCLPVKVYVGHILNLIDKGVDKIFVPSFQSIAPKIYNCSKIRGLPDLIRNVVKKDFQMIEATLDKSEKNQGFYEFLKEIVGPFGITDEKRIKKASKAGWKVYNNFKIMSRSGMSYKQAMNYALQGKVFISQETREYPISVALVSHPYNIYDEQISMRIFDKLNDMDVKVYSANELTPEQMQEGINALNQRLYWANEYEMTGCAGHYLKDNKIDGIINLTAFGCGPDSLMIERINRKAKKFNKPILNLTIDEHTGEAGFVTRLEAFVDMLYRKKRAKIINKIKLSEDEYIPNTNFIKIKETEKSQDLIFDGDFV
ncbi:MAG TPA: acyl-CoA dehydratase activase-related protein [Candidatus Gastranaerophilaceae bacterium]|nr:acyl-CoA dehydratase activase-related protein [Candidatus Gastranaerophilaceae bacterium]HPT41571.1 acyl-CoA dehydratase activase-related protein [Candidatus Gastranaerophilaceae bacterium]